VVLYKQSTHLEQPALDKIGEKKNCALPHAASFGRSGLHSRRSSKAFHAATMNIISMLE
jgi:hypothetical protein